MNKFVATMGDPVVKVDHVVVRFKAAASQLGAVVSMASFTGAGAPRPFWMRVVAKGCGGFVSEATYLGSIRIGKEGDAVVTVLASGFDIGALVKLLGDQNVIVGFKEGE